MPTGRLSVVVLSSSDVGGLVAARLAALPAVSRVVLMTAPMPEPRRSRLGNVRYIWRMHGLGVLVRVVLERLRGRPPEPPKWPSAPIGVKHLRFPDFHTPECLAALRELAPDLGVLTFTYILREEVFSIPRLGAINLHCGKAPEYRGSAPGFWELYNGEREIGITVHRVTAKLDAGDIFLQELFPLDPCPEGDVLAYLRRYRSEVVLPNGVRLVAEAVRRIAEDRVEAWAQDQDRAHTYRRPDRAAIRELRRRIAARRAARAGRGG